MNISLKIFLTLFSIGTAIAIVMLILDGTLTPTMIFALAFLLSVLFCTLGYYFIVSPIKSLKEAIDEISRGKLDLKIEPKLLKNDDEIGDLARAFDRVLVSLKYAVNMVGISKERLKLGEMVTEKKETEKKLKLTEEFLNTIIENMGVPVIAYSRKGELLIANKKFTETTGYTKEDIINLDKFKANALPAKMANDKFIKEITQFRKGEDVDNFVLPIRCKSGKTIMVAGDIASVKDTDGSVKGEAIFMRDLNEVFSLEKEIRHWAANGFVQERVDEHHHNIEISKNVGEKVDKKSKNRR